MFWYGYYGWISFIYGLFWLIIFILIITFLVRWSMRYTTTQINQIPGGNHQPSAIEILEQRYARGEIDAAMFEEIRSRILSSRQQDNPSATNGG